MIDSGNPGIPTLSRSCQDLPKTAGQRFGPRLDLRPNGRNDRHDLAISMAGCEDAGVLVTRSGSRQTMTLGE